MNKKLQEERLYERLNLPIKVNYEVSTRPHNPRKATSKNIGGGGICLSLSEKLVPETRLKINISLPKMMPPQHPKAPANTQKPTKQESYELEGRVAWSRTVELTTEGVPSAYYDTGIQFLESDPIIIGRIVACFRGREI